MSSLVQFGDSDEYSDNDEDYGDEERVYRVMCRP
jgi:hypothetical protein